jgi:hypothetical protein
MTPNKIKEMIKSGELKMRKQAQIYMKKYFADKDVISYYETRNTYYFVVRKNNKKVLLFEVYISNPSVGEASTSRERIYEKDVNYMEAIKNIRRNGIIFEQDLWETFLSEAMVEAL